MERMDAPRGEETLDPEDWGELRALGRRMIDDMLEYLETVRERPVWQPIPEEVKGGFRAPLPLEPCPPAEVYRRFKEKVLPHPMGNIHPRFWGWVIGTGSAFGMLVEMLAAGMNSNAGGANHIAYYVESQVLEWCREMLGYPAGSSGLLVSGGSMANLIGLAVARNSRAGFDVRAKGVQGSPVSLRVYGSREMHSSIQKAVELLGLGGEGLRRVPVDPEYRVDVRALESAIDEDKGAGFRPVCVVGNAGTVNTGAVDDLNALADLCEREGLWFHVDGAFGALAALSGRLKPMLAGMERADSLAFDLHKWMYMPYEIGCALVRHPDEHFRAFALSPDYLAHSDRGLAGIGTWFSDYGVELSRCFRALKAWMLIQEHGIKKYGRLVEQNVDQARYLARLVDERPRLERLAPVPLNIVCFRFAAGGLAAGALDDLNRELLIRLQESGAAAPSHTTLGGKYALRVAVTNHRSRREDFELLVEEADRIGTELLEGVGRGRGQG